MKHYFITLSLVAALLSPASNSSAAIFFVDANGEDVPNRDGRSSATAWASLAYAVSNLPTGDCAARNIIYMGSGTFLQSVPVRLPSGVDIVGAGSKATTLVASWTNSPLELSKADPAGRLIQIQGPGNNAITGVSFDGNGRRAAGAIWLGDSTNVTLANLSFTNFGSATLVLGKSCGQILVSNAFFGECGYESTNYSLGMIQIFQLDQGMFTQIKMRSSREGSGYGFKVSGLNGHGNQQTYLADTVFEKMDIRLKQIQAYGNAGYPNFALEFFMAAQTNNFLRYNYFGNTVSQSSSDNAGGTTREGNKPSMRIHDNVFELQETAYAIECKTHRLEIDHNTFRGGYGVMNDWTCGQSAMDSLHIHHNVAEEAGEWFFGFTGAQFNLRIHDNSVRFADKKSHSAHVFLNNSNMGKTAPENFEIYNNVAVAPTNYPGAFYRVQNGNTLTPVNVTFRNNKYHNMSFNPPEGATVIANSNQPPEPHDVLFGVNKSGR